MRPILQPTHKRPRAQPILVKEIWWGPPKRSCNSRILGFLYQGKIMQTATATIRRPVIEYPEQRIPTPAATRQGIDQRKQKFPHPYRRLDFELFPPRRLQLTRPISRRSYRLWHCQPRQPIWAHPRRHRDWRIIFPWCFHRPRNKEASREAAGSVKSSGKRVLPVECEAMSQCRM